ncbi:type II secretion system protein XpsI [Xanthomonas translucens]|uniref:type II secretion system protein XpsI n=1 Tax=Xanthomonas campestris pv. translucens TaxID=343 RepID=UPI000642010E|nr:prepilin-type N-terminal cleavage/methylation domain-containing protein [Xanthomonas translucens]AKK68929.1 general secretion pathway protein GspI [Xanthomonas translucens pv. undulosa]AVY67884.1 general secretion pathway protein GspI [Xanthomonas translucens pv. undulosa]MCT8269128.1 prepilin-type N-terminal cleavage/methylation domain-containing protein [Xanthomonas translucens pv. undulosa]QEN94797.1 prepilin-type N-terminal cleavage/methylation domain-containing protein [Xanthomonas tran
MKAQRGYTLIEVIVAFALLALALTLLLGSLSGAARQVKRADQLSRATLYAQSLLAAQGVEQPLQPGRAQGSFEQGHYRWTLDVAPYVDARRPPDTTLTPGLPTLLQLNLQVRWGDASAQALQWKTLRLVSAQNNGMPQ